MHYKTSESTATSHTQVIHDGDGEIKTVIGPNHQQVLSSIAEKKSKFMVMTKVENKTAALVATTTSGLLRPMEEKCFRPMRRWPRHWSLTTYFSARFLLVARAEPEHQWSYQAILAEEE